MDILERMFYSPKVSYFPQVDPTLEEDPDINKVINVAVGNSEFHSAKEYDIEVIQILQSYNSAPVSPIPRNDFSSIQDWKVNISSSKSNKKKHPLNLSNYINNHHQISSH